MLTKQTIYDRIKEHLLKQNKQSVTAGGGCKYRGPDGLKCAIGALIPDECYLPIFDELGYDMSALLVKYSVIQIFGEELAPEVNVGFLRRLQAIHDFEKPEHWSEALNKFADECGLNP